MLLPQRCPTCGIDNPGEFAFCWTCGRFLADEQVALFPASRARRTVAALIDLGLGLALLQAHAAAPAHLKFIPLGLAAAYGIALIFLLSRGETVGKRLMGLVIVTVSGRPIGLVRHLLRAVLWWPGAALGTLTFFARYFNAADRDDWVLSVGFPEMRTPYDRGVPNSALTVVQGQMLHDRWVRSYVATAAAPTPGEATASG